MSSEQIPCWLLFSHEKSDCYFEKFITSKTSTPAIAIISDSKCFVFVHELDASNVDIEGVIVGVYKTRDDLWSSISKAMQELGYPDKIALNYSTFGDKKIDVLGHGAFKMLEKRLRNIYGEKKFKLCSAENIVYALSDKKSDQDVEKMKISARRASELIEVAFSKIKAGMSEIDVKDIMHEEMESKPEYFKEAGVLKEELAWEMEHCPVVLAGKNLKKGGHSEASTNMIEKGDTVYIDFGVCLYFKDGKWCSDLQRMAYILRDDETEAPKEIQDIFNALKKAVEKGMKAMKPGVKGYEIDKIVRKEITKKYPNYNHATGHAVGEETHNTGVIISTGKKGLSALKLQHNGVYTLEPRIQIENGGSIEEMIVVKETPEFLCERQERLYLIRHS